MRTVLLDKASAVVTGAALPLYKPNRTYQATVTGTGAVTANVIIEGSNDGAGWVQIGDAIALTGTDLATDGFPSVEAWAMVRARVTAVTGTDAAVTVSAGSA